MDDGGGGLGCFSSPLVVASASDLFPPFLLFFRLGIFDTPLRLPSCILNNHAYMHTYIHRHTYTYVHTYIYIYIYAYIYILQNTHKNTHTKVQEVQHLIFTDYDCTIIDRSIILEDELCQGPGRGYLFISQQLFIYVEIDGSRHLSSPSLASFCSFAGAGGPAWFMSVIFKILSVIM